MLEKYKKLIINMGEALIEKTKELKDPVEIGKCLRTYIVASAFVGSTYIICKNGGINYNNKLLIGTKGSN